METTVKIRVQAHGGKYLGPALAQTPPVVTITVPGQAPMQPMQVPTGTSGTVSKSQDGAASPYPIVVQPPGGGSYTPGNYYLDPQPPPNSGQSPDNYLTVTLDLPEASPTDVLFTVTAAAPQPVTVSTVVPIVGGDTRYANDPGLVLLVPGLRITNASASASGEVTANVAMMCGCQIGADDATPMEPYWPAYEFGVFASIPGFPSVELTCTNPKELSVFTGTLPVAAPPNTPVLITAAQKNSPNSNQVTVTVSS